MHVGFIRKRDGQQVPFQPRKIWNAVKKAAHAAGASQEDAVAEEITNKALSYLNIFFDEAHLPTVEQVQDLVEKLLIEEGYADVAKAYILYREQHARLRDTKKLLEGAADLVQKYLKKLDWKVHENSNMSYSLQGLNNYIASEITSQYWLHEIYPKKIREAHLSGDLHIHDLSNLSVYCCGWDLQDLLMNGFTGVQTKIGSRPPRHFRTALGQIVNFFYTMQGEAAGAQAFSNFDTLLAPFIAYDNLSYRDVKQALQEFVFNLNVPTRVGFPDSLYEHHHGSFGTLLPGEAPRHRGGQPHRPGLREFSKRDGHDQPGLCGGHAGGRRHWKGLPLPYSYLQRHQRFRLG